MRLASTHNALMAERDLGKDVMDQYRRSDDRVSEPVPIYSVRTEYSSASPKFNPVYASGD